MLLLYGSNRVGKDLYTTMLYSCSMRVIYKKVSIPKPLISEVKEHIRKFPRLGYTSVSDFVKSSIRDKLARDVSLHRENGTNSNGGGE